MNPILVEKDYKKVLHYFNEISAVPRGSKNNTAISNYLVEYAKSHGLEYVQDEYENVVIIKEASKGYENAPAVIIQGHMDMVCEKTNDCTHDFLTEGIDLFVDGDYIHADRTTLGADNGIALAYSLAFLEDETLKHPRIEAIFTTDEEVGMDGAIGLDVSILKGKYLINVDSEEEGSLLISSAGGLTATCELPVKRINEKGLKVHLSISELQGGHSGAEIHKNRTNATKLMARLLFELKDSTDFYLADLAGGLKDNAIPREASSYIVVESKELDALQETVKSLTAKYKNELVTSEPGLTIDVAVQEEGKYSVLHPTSFEKLLFLLLNTPNGVQVMSSDISGLVESSLNLGIFKMEEEKAVYCFSVRSSVNSYKQFICSRLQYMANFLGGEFYVRGQYPAWEYKKESFLRDHMCKIFKEQYGREAKLEAIHAGLECSFFAEKIPGVDIVSLGPDMNDIHTPKERLSISSAIRVYQYLEKVIEGIQ
ncbi:aminoacyl-histidine dipeptidase [Anaerocolumna cellulosilytica]|uniref:Cytosol non-specific dipeptidase n=1 Tax=Anaerocolumna cellulosilytica TaxID=433286 RepID=A0A6S6R7G4_9FIRM|nr:aminoacyl-histidine dipeptidase [Anaerocolumna cellulosilytica]MBB5196991.1 dipeptidase D [Anaerocolumna cellulosilytica]BCJ95205.1 aminoacyl-histidine dipeptidase [Anaerocolumna cellulosilytica]